MTQLLGRRLQTDIRIFNRQTSAFAWHVQFFISTLYFNVKYDTRANIEGVVQFLMNAAEEQALPLPGFVQGLKRILLPRENVPKFTDRTLLLAT